MAEALGDSVGIDLINDPEQIWVVMTGSEIQPLDVFLDRAVNEYDQANEDFHQVYGHDLPILEEPTDSRSIARRIQFWEYVRRRYAEIALIQTTVCRRYLKGLMVSNIEFDTVVDYPIWGEAFDIPGFNMRTALFDDEVGYRYWVGYGTRLSADLTHRDPMISVRTNVVAAGPRIIPTRAATRSWYSRAIQNGAAGFFLWIRDFQSDLRTPSAYAGPCMANPDPSARSAERWQTHLEASHVLSRTATFRPPRAETGILISIPSCAAGAWLSVFSAYVETVRAGIFVRFVSSVDLRASDREVKGLRLLFVPTAQFEHRSVTGHLIQVVREGLTLVIADSQSFLYAENGDPNVCGPLLTGLHGTGPRERAESVTIGHLQYRTYRAGDALAPASESIVIGRYQDGQPAAVEQRLGAGRVITLGAPLLDFYSSGLRSFDAEDPARLVVMEHWRRASGAADHFMGLRRWQFRAQPRRPLLDVVLMVLRGQTQCRVQRVDADATRVAIEVRAVERDPSVHRRQLLCISRRRRRRRPHAHAASVCSSSAAYCWRITVSGRRSRAGTAWPRTGH